MMSDVWVFLDCVLDNTVKELDTLIAFPKSEICLKVIPTIVKRCPQLSQLLINFVETNFTDNEEDSLEGVKAVVLQLSSLEHLKDLNVYGLTYPETLTALLTIGKSCPSLSHLNVDGYGIEKKHLLALMMGEALVDWLPPNEDEASWCTDDALEHLVIPHELLSPICFNLVELHLDGQDSTITESAISFALRHLPSLKKMGKKLPVSLGIKILYYVYHKGDRIQKEFEKADPRKGNVSSAAPNFSGTKFMLSNFILK